MLYIHNFDTDMLVEFSMLCLVAALDLGSQ